MFSLSEITWACEQLSQLALGFFVVHVAGRCYGIRKPDASMLGVSFDQVDKRIARRGSHNPPFPMNAAAADVAYSFRRAIFDESGERERFFGMSVPQFSEAISSNHVQWVSDEEFDDSSYVLQFEDENEVRLVAFTGTLTFVMSRLVCVTFLSHKTSFTGFSSCGVTALRMNGHLSLKSPVLKGLWLLELCSRLRWLNGCGWSTLSGVLRLRRQKRRLRSG